MFVITKKTYENNDIEVIVDNNGTLWLNEKYIEKKKNQTRKVQQSLQENAAQTIESIDLNQQTNEKSNQTEGFYINIQR